MFPVLADCGVTLLVWVLQSLLLLLLVFGCFSHCWLLLLLVLLLPWSLFLVVTVVRSWCGWFVVVVGIAALAIVVLGVVLVVIVAASVLRGPVLPSPAQVLVAESTHP
jgi:hypothetical protein